MSSDIKKNGDFRRRIFIQNIRLLIFQNLRCNILQASKELDVDYRWLRKCCSVGLSRADNRNVLVLAKVADRFGIKVNDFWAETKVQGMNEIEDKIKEAARKFVNENFRFPTSDMDYLVIENAMKTAICMYVEMQVADLKQKPLHRPANGASM